MNDDLPSLELVATEVDRLVDEQERRSDRYDTVAGLLVGFCAALIGLSGDVGLLGAAAKVASAASAGASLAALVVRVQRRPRPRALRRYGSEPLSLTRVVLLDSKVWQYEQDEVRLELKLTRLRVSLACLGIGVAFSLASALNVVVR
jgi:hypothetical protein